MAWAFVSKTVYNHSTNCATIGALKISPVFRRICGFVKPGDVTSEATFSRALGEFARHGLGERVHETLGARYVKPELVGYLSRGIHRHPGPGEAQAESAAPQAGAPEKRPTAPGPRRGERG
jgi:hypothetical protein